MSDRINYYAGSRDWFQDEMSRRRQYLHRLRKYEVPKFTEATPAEIEDAIRNLVVQWQLNSDRCPECSAVAKVPHHFHCAWIASFAKLRLLLAQERCV